MKETRRSFLTSCMALLLCFVMLLGSTFAWFTDTVTSSGNKIVSGTLDLDLQLKDKDTGSYSSINESSDPLFNYDKWEPGYTDVKVLKVHNAGSLSFKWVSNFVSSETITDLAKVIDVYVKTADSDIDYPGAMIELTEANGWKLVDTLDKIIDSTTQPIKGELLSGESDYFAVALHMQETAGNEYQDTSLGAFDIALHAIQLSYESDSFGNDYDGNVALVTNANELQAALAAGQTPVLPDGSVYEEPDDAIVVWDTAELTSALEKANNGKTVFLAAGEYTLPVITDNTVEGFTIIGTSLAKVANDMAKTNYFKNITFENITFTNNIVAKFAGNGTIKNCTFISNGVEATKQCTVVKNATLTIEGCTFNGVDRIKNLHFGGNDGATVVVKDCVFNRGYVAFGRTMNITLENCDFNGGVASCYGSYTFNNCTFDADAQVYIHVATAATEVNLTMNGCTVDGGADVTSVCYNTGNNNGGVKTFTIDGKVYNHDELQAFPSN